MMINILAETVKKVSLNYTKQVVTVIMNDTIFPDSEGQRIQFVVR